MCAIISKAYGWDLRKKAKISSNNTKKGHLWTFYNFPKTVQAIETIFYNHSTSYRGTMWAVRSKPYGWDLRKKEKVSSKNTNKAIFGFFIFLTKTVQAIEFIFCSRSTSY